MFFVPTAKYTRHFIQSANYRGTTICVQFALNTILLYQVDEFWPLLHLVRHLSNVQNKHYCLTDTIVRTYRNYV